VFKPKQDNKVLNTIERENQRQKSVLRLIPSENYVSEGVGEALSSSFGNKYSEGYPKRRYYQGNENVDELETLAIERAKKLFKVPYANVQPYSGSIANAAVYFSLLKYNDVILGMGLNSGGHLTHGYPKITFSGKYFRSYSYSVDHNGFIDYDDLYKAALEHKPKLIISGASSYPRSIDFVKIGQIADEVNAYHMADISHISGLVVGGAHSSPVKYAHIVTTTTHKTLRGPRGAMILVTEKGLQKNPDLAKNINKGVFPGMQGGPHENTIAGIAVCLKEATTREFREYASQIVKNAQYLAVSLKEKGFNLVSGGTDNHLLLLNFSDTGIDAWLLAWALEFGGIIVNRNTIPNEPGSSFHPSGIRLGTPAVTSLGLKENDMERIGCWIAEIAEITRKYQENAGSLDRKIRLQLKGLLSKDSRIIEIAKEIKDFVNLFFY